MENRAGYNYKVLFEVSVSHDYYLNGICPHLAVCPTYHTQQLMGDLVLQLKSTPAGFMVLYDELRKSSLLNFIKVNGPWSRLSFFMQSTTPYFGNLTDLPVDMLSNTLYLTNNAAHKDFAKVVLHPGPYEKGAQTLKVINAELKVELPGTGSFYVAEITDVSGKVEITRSSLGAKGISVFYIDMSPLPEGRYTLHLMEEGERVVLKETFVYTIIKEPVLGCMDIFLQDPLLKNPDFYPVQHDVVAGCSYLIRFAQRSTCWNYFMIFSNRKERSLFIKSTDPEIAFDGPEEVTIGNGVMAYQFVSQVDIPLKEQSPFRFKLLERSVPGSDEEIVGRLPLAGVEQLLPVDGRSFSNIYVNV